MISITIPTYNRAHLISRAINSVIKQDFIDWELIIVDDGSTDNTEEVVDDFLLDPRIHYVRKVNSGATHTRNVGVENSNGEYITFLDSDDEAQPNWLSSFHSEISNGAEVVCCGMEFFDENGEFIKKVLPKSLGPLFDNRIARFSNGGVFILKKSFFDKIEGYDINLTSGQHSELAIRLFELFKERDIDIVNIFEPLIKVHVHQGPKIRSDHSAIFSGSSYTLKKHGKLFAKHPLIYANYLGVAAWSAVKLKKYDSAKALFYKSWKLDPFNLKRFGRLVIINIPVLRKIFW